MGKGKPMQQLPDEVQRYLTYIDHGVEGLIDPDKVQDLEAMSADDTLDKFEKAKARLELIDLQRGAEANVVNDFVTKANAWLNKQANISRDDFVEVMKELGVPGSVLDQIDSPYFPTGSVTKANTVASIQEFTGCFFKKDVTKRCGASGNTLNKALKECVDAGLIKDLGGNPKKYQALA